MNDALTQQFVQLINKHTGLFIRQSDREALVKKLWLRINSLNLSAPERYYQLLNSSSHQSHSALVQPEQEWKELTQLLTTGESYFFRDRGQINLLKNRILPELIKQKQQASFAQGKTKPTLRIWSAGCSTGEEVYSLAILIQELIPDWQQWQILILGTDINPESVETAKRGIYSSWSFRLVEPQIQLRYFQQHQTNWKISEQIHPMVTFRLGNLIKDSFPNRNYDLHSMDLIICRNVFIYFDAESIAVVLAKFYQTLNPEGYLITGHAELQGQDLGQLRAKVLPESVVYQRSQDLPISSILPSQILFRSNCTINKANQTMPTRWQSITSTPGSSVTRSPVTATPHLSQKQPQPVLNQAKILFLQGKYASAITEAEEVIKQHPQHFGAYYLMAQACANMGNLPRATHFCHQALKIDSLSVKPYYLLAHIATEQGNIEQVKNFFKKIIYLSPTSITAHLELGKIYINEGDNKRGIKILNTALELLKELPASAIVEDSDEVTAGELLLHIKKILKQQTSS